MVMGNLFYAVFIVYFVAIIVGIVALYTTLVKKSEIRRTPFLIHFLLPSKNNCHYSKQEAQEPYDFLEEEHDSGQRKTMPTMTRIIPTINEIKAIQSIVINRNVIISGFIINKSVLFFYGFQYNKRPVTGHFVSGKAGPALQVFPGVNRRYKQYLTID